MQERDTAVICGESFRLLAFTVPDTHTRLAIMRALGLSCDVITITRGKNRYSTVYLLGCLDGVL